MQESCKDFIYIHICGFWSNLEMDRNVIAFLIHSNFFVSIINGRWCFLNCQVIWMPIVVNVLVCVSLLSSSTYIFTFSFFLSPLLILTFYFSKNFFMLIYAHKLHVTIHYTFSFMDLIEYTHINVHSLLLITLEYH